MGDLPKVTQVEKATSQFNVISYSYLLYRKSGNILEVAWYFSVEKKKYLMYTTNFM